MSFVPGYSPCPVCGGVPIEVGEGKIIYQCGHVGIQAQGFSTQEQGPAIGGADTEAPATPENVQKLVAFETRPKQERLHSFYTGEQLDAGGDATIYFPAIQPGFSFRLERLVIEFAGYTPASIYDSSDDADFYVAFYRNAIGVGALIDYVAYVPSSADYDSNGPFLRENEVLVCQIVDGPVSTQAAVQAHGVLLDSGSIFDQRP